MLVIITHNVVLQSDMNLSPQGVQTNKQFSLVVMHFAPAVIAIMPLLKHFFRNLYFLKLFFMLLMPLRTGLKTGKQAESWE